MKKEELKLSGITQDLKIVVKDQIKSRAEWRLAFIVPVTLSSILVGVILKNVWISLLIFSVSAYHIVRYILDCRRFIAKKKAVVEAVEHADISISVEQFDHVACETIYEPHMVGLRGDATKTVKYYYFSSGGRWRIPLLQKHYAWSKEYYISSKGLENISIRGDEFYFVSLKEYGDIAYIYPCKNFELDENLKNDL